jgi:hypothetical protein
MSARAARMSAIAAFALLLAVVAPRAHAQQLRAWLDRDHVALGETATLNIEVEGATFAEPDYSPLLNDFEVSGNTSSRSMASDASGTRVRTLYAVALQPRRAGTIPVPALAVGARRTPPLSLEVTASSAPPAQAGDTVFIESAADATSPYVQQAVGYTVRLYLGVPLVSGQLEQAEPDGATLRQVGDDVRYQRELRGRSYTVFERHYLLVPERSGALAIPPARFVGRGVGGFFDDLMGDAQQSLVANGAARTLQVRAIPANAPQPWLPLQALTLRWAQAPADARVGGAATVVLEAVADGATAAQLPTLDLPPITGAQVFPDPPRRDEAFVDGRPRATVVRSFSIVPSAAGEIRVEAPRLSWWDANAGVARVATLPPLVLSVAPAGVAPAAGAAGPAGAGANAAGAAAPGVARDDAWIHVPGVQGRVRPWAFATVAFALLWLITFMWGLHRHPRAADADAAPRVRGAGDGGAVRHAAHGGRAGLVALRKALEQGTLGDVADALRGTAHPPAASLDALRARLADPAQQAALDALQRALWGGGDGAEARASLRAAFASGPKWTPPPAGADRGPLPPLYP